MKKYITSAFSLLILCAMIPLQMFAGSLNEIVADQTTHEGEYRTCLTVTMDTDADDLRKAWTKYLRKNYDVKMSGKSFMSAEKVNVASVSDRTLDLYTRLVEEDGSVQMEVFGRYGYDVYITPNTSTEDFQSMRQLLASFVNSYLPTLYMEKIEAQKEVIEDLADEKEDYLKDVNDINEDMADNEEDIAELKAENEKLAKEAKDTEELMRIQSVQMAEEEKKLEQLKSALNNAKNK